MEPSPRNNLKRTFPSECIEATYSRQQFSSNMSESQVAKPSGPTTVAQASGPKQMIPSEQSPIPHYGHTSVIGVDVLCVECRTCPQCAFDLVARFCGSFLNIELDSQDPPTSLQSPAASQGALLSPKRGPMGPR